MVIKRIALQLGRVYSSAKPLGSLWGRPTLSPCLGFSASGVLELLNASLRFLLGKEDPGCLIPKLPAGWFGEGPSFSCFCVPDLEASEEKNRAEHGVESLGFLGPSLSFITFKAICKCHVKVTHLNPLMSKRQRASSGNKMSFHCRWDHFLGRSLGTVT